MSEDEQLILVVDDEPGNLQVIKETLKELYRLAFANSGEQAIEIAKKLLPDLVLMDIMMPKLDGYQTCQRFKETPMLQEIPIIFATALGEEDDESKGFKVGGVDYITKPLKPTILKARVKTHLELKQARDELIKQNEILKENEKLRNDIDSITRHDLKGPLQGIIGFPKLVLSQAQLTEKQQDFLNRTVKLAYNMLNMINFSLDLVKMEKGIYKYEAVPVDIIAILDDIIEENKTLIKKKQIEPSIQVEGTSPAESETFSIMGDQLLLYSMFSNIIKNAVEASPENQPLSISIHKADQAVIRIHNYGAVPAEIRDTFFEKYVTAGKEGGTGLGTYSARLIAETHSGDIQLESDEENGTAIILTLPITRKK